ncbi:MAG: branched-chain amino acid ABC transporter permease, partial [Deltaproteobacteria bacterium]|nr:branched-chain amino acid ABC transporter permease [Deltaproteobacteria bacterium]
MSDILQYLISGLTIGAIYALVAVGFHLIFKATEIFNFAQGTFVVFGGLLAYSMVVS